MSAGCGEIVWLERRAMRPGFTPRDRMELARWASVDGRAVVFDDEPTAYAMLYEGVMPWATWAVARQDEGLVVWDCITFADIGRFRCMVDALAAIGDPVSAVPDRVSNILPFTAANGPRVSERLGARTSL